MNDELCEFFRFRQLRHHYVHTLHYNDHLNSNSRGRVNLSDNILECGEDVRLAHTAMCM